MFKLVVLLFVIKLYARNNIYSAINNIIRKFSINTKKSFFQLSVWDNKVLSIPKIIICLANSWPKLNETDASNAIPRSL